MKIVVASDSFKGSLSSRQIGELVQKAAQAVSPLIEVCAVEIADGGEGTVDAFFKAAGKCKQQVSVLGPNSIPLDATYAILQDDTAVIEVASVVGLAQHQGRYNIMEASSFGVGQLIKHALSSGCRNLLIGLGGSCTSDGGMGLAEALGFSFLDAQNRPVKGSPRGLAQVCSIKTDDVYPGFWDATITFACDVTNPLYGYEGAAYIFAPQKGADETEVRCIDEGLRCWGNAIFCSTGVDLQTIEGTGAAGGMCSIPFAFGQASLRPGLELLLEKLDFPSLIEGADLIITGEGRLDSQSLHGKVPLTIAQCGIRAKVPVVGLVGTVEQGLPDLRCHGIGHVFTISDEDASWEEITQNSAANYYNQVVSVLDSLMSQRA